MAEEKKENNLPEEEKDKSEKIIYILTGLLVFVIFGAIAVLYFNPSTEEKVYKPEKIQVVAEKNKNNTVNNAKENNTIDKNKAEENKSIEKNEDKTIENIKQSTETKPNLENNKHLQIAKKEDNTVDINQANTLTSKNENKKEEKSKVNVESLKENKQQSKSTEIINNKQEEKNIAQNKEKVINAAKNGEVNKEKEVVKKETKKEVKKQPTEKTAKKEKKKAERKYYYIQVSAIASLEKANQLKNRLERKGFKRVIIIKEKGLYKVLVGRFTSMKDAFKFIREHNIKGGWVRIIKE